MKPGQTDTCRDCGVTLRYEARPDLGPCAWCNNPAKYRAIFTERGCDPDESDQSDTCGCEFPTLDGLKHHSVCDGHPPTTRGWSNIFIDE